MNGNSINTFLQGHADYNKQMEEHSAELTKAGAQIESQAMDDALWRMAANNAMAKLKGFNQLAKSANDLS